MRHAERRSSRVRGARRSIVIAALASVWMLPAPARAYDTTSGGHPGGVRVYQVEGFHDDDCVGITSPYPGINYTCYNPTLVIRGALVSRSPGTRRGQVVAMATSVQQWTGSGWQAVWNQSQGRTIARRARHAQFADARVRLPRGYYRVLSTFVWNGRERRSHGTRAVTMNSPGDYICTGLFAQSACDASAGYIYLVAATAH